MSLSVKEQPRTKHIMAYFELHKNDWMCCTTEGLLKHFALIYTGTVEKNKRMSTLLSLYYKEGLLMRKTKRVRSGKVAGLWRGHHRNVFYYKFKE